MFMSVVDDLRHDAIYPDLAGARVLVTGADSAFGVDIARAFADHATRLIVQTGEVSPEMEGVASVLAVGAAGLQIFETALDDADAATRFLQGPAQATFGGLEILVNLVRFTHQDLAGRVGLDQIEDLIAEKLVPATMMGRIAANRMRLTMRDGLILNVIATPRQQSPREMALVDMIRATLASMTRREAQGWAEEGIRFNAVGPCSLSDELTADRSLGGEADVAALALYLASGKGHRLTGHVFDATNLGGL